MTSWMAFGAGRRNCPGEQLARPRLFLAVTYLLQSFTFSPPDGEEPADPDPRNYLDGIPLKPEKFKVKASARWVHVEMKWITQGMSYFDD